MLAAQGVRMRVLYQPLIDLSIGCFEVGISSARASDTILLIDDQLTDEVNGLMIMLCCWTLFFCPQFLIIFFHENGDTKIITILKEWSQPYAYQSSSLLFF